MNKAFSAAALGALLLPTPTQTPTDDAPQVEFALRISGTRVQLKAKGRKTNFTSRWRISLHKGSVRLLNLDSSVETILDRERQRLIYLDHGKRRVRTRPLLGWIAALDQERMHRLGLAKMLDSLPFEGAKEAFQSFWIESLFRYGEEAAGEVKITERKGAFVCTRGTETVLETTPGGPKLPRQLRSEYRLFLVRMFHIHPAIRERLVKVGSIPRRIHFRSYNIGSRTDTDLVVSSLPPKSEKPPETVAPGKAMSSYAPWVDPKDALDVLLRDIETKRIGTQPTSRAEYASRVSQLAKAGHHLDAFLVFTESRFAFWDIPVEQARAIDLKSEDAAPLAKIMNPGKSETELAAAEQAIRAFPRDGLQGAATLDILRATLLARLKRYREAERLFLKVLRKKPWLVGPFMDLGQTYAKRFAMQKAWRCWQHAYDLAPKNPMVQGFLQLQANLRKQYASWL